MPGNRRKVKLKNPANLISAIAVLVGSVILSLIIHQNFFLVFISSFLVYIAAYVFFEKRRLHREMEDEYDDEDYDDYEDDAYYEEEEVAPVKQPIRPARRENNSFDVVKSAKFNDTVSREVEVEPEVTEEQKDDSWRSMYNNLTDSSADTSFEEDYKKYFSTTLPDREEVSKASQQSPQPAFRPRRENSRRDERKNYNRNDEYYDTESADVLEYAETETTFESASERTQEDSSEESSDENDEDEDGHIIDADEIETETQAIQSQVNDLITNKTPEDAVLAKSITAKLKFFRKTRKQDVIEEDYDQDEVMTSNLQLIDELYTDAAADTMAQFKQSAPRENTEEDLSAETTNLTEPEDGTAVSGVQAIGHQIIEILKQADVEASLKDVVVGASVIRYDIRPRSMSKLNRIAKLESTLEAALHVGKIRVVDVGSNRSMAGIEIPNPERSNVLFQDCINSEAFQMNRSTTSCVLGRDAYGDVILADLKNLSHLLIVGQDAEEKNMCMHTLISSILSKVGVFHVDFVMIDISERELNVYDPVPHMYSPVLNFADDALCELEALEKVIDTRLDLFQRNNVRDLVSYNASKSETPLSRIIVFINELGDLMEHDDKRTETLLSGILQKSRSTGVHFVIGTAHPSEDVLTGRMKANMPSKICFALENAEDSELILDTTGAEKLLGDGDMLYYPKGYLAPKRVQCASLSKEDVEALVESIL